MSLAQEAISEPERDNPRFKNIEKIEVPNALVDRLVAIYNKIEQSKRDLDEKASSLIHLIEAS